MTRQDLITAARQQLGLDNTPPADWTYDQRVNYNKLLASLIAANADSFPPQEVAVARQVEAKVSDPLADVSALDDLKTFGDEFGNQLLQAGQKVAAVGTGALDSVSIIGKALPVLTVIALVGLVAWGYFSYVAPAKAAAAK